MLELQFDESKAHYSPEEHEDFCNQAREAGLDVLYATDYDVFVDLDTKQDHDMFWCRARAFQSEVLFSDIKITVSQKRGNWHGICKLTQPLTLLERIALQCVLGSDRTREYITVMRWIKNPGETKSVLFEVKS
jgi:hypothetical protein